MFNPIRWYKERKASQDKANKVLKKLAQEDTFFEFDISEYMASDYVNLYQAEPVTVEMLVAKDMEMFDEIDKRVSAQIKTAK